MGVNQAENRSGFEKACETLATKGKASRNEVSGWPWQ